MILYGFGGPLKLLSAMRSQTGGSLGKNIMHT